MGRFLKIYKFGIFLFVLQLCLHTVFCSFSVGDYIFRRTRTIASSVEPQSLAEIVQVLKTGWDRGKQTSILTQVGILVERLQASGSSLSAFSEYSSSWLDLYLNTVLSEGGLLDSDRAVRGAVLMVKKVMETNNFATILGDDSINIELLNVLRSLCNDLHRSNFSQLLSEDKENILKAAAQIIPYEERLGFYIAFQPGMYEIYKTMYGWAYEEAKAFFDTYKTAYESAITQGRCEAGYDYDPTEVTFSLQTLPIANLIPIHIVSADSGYGSSGFRNRSEEIDKGMIFPVSVIRVRGMLYIAGGHKRTLNCLERGITNIPAFIIDIKNPPLDLVLSLQNAAESQGLNSIEDLALKNLVLPDKVNTDLISAGILATQDTNGLPKLIGDTIIKSIVDSVRDNGHVTVLMSVKNLQCLSDALNSNNFYGLYLEDWSKVKILLYAPDEAKTDSITAVFHGPGTAANIRIISAEQELSQLAENENIDLAVTDFTTIATDNAVSSALTESGTKTAVIISSRTEGLLAQYRIACQDSQVMSVLNNPENLLLTDASSIAVLLPRELRPAPVMLELNTMAGISGDLGPVISEIKSDLIQAEGLGRPVFVAIDGWLGSGIRGVVVNYLRKHFPNYRSEVLNVDNYRLPVDRTRKETSSPITIPNVGETVLSDIDIDVTRIDSARIAIKTQFDETIIPIPAIGREVKLEGHAIFIKRKNADTLEIRLSPAITHLELGRLYRDIQLLREGETVYVPFVDADNKRVVVSEVDRLVLIQENEPLRSLEERQLRRIANPKDSWRAISPNSSFWLDVQTGDVLYELNPNECEIIFIAGELSLHQESVNLLYDVRLFVDAEFSERVERAVRYHILTGYYFDKTVAGLKAYMESQRTELEDPFLFDDREQARYIITNKILPDETMLQQLHGMSLSQRIDKAIEVAEAEKIKDPWDILETYVLPITGRGSNFRIALEYIINTHKTNPTTFSGIDFAGLIDSTAEPFSLLDTNDKWNLYAALCNVGLIITQNINTSVP